MLYAKYRLPDGRQVQKKIGPAWSERGRPPVGYFTRRQPEAWLDAVLHLARRGTLPGQVLSGVNFSEAAEEWLRFIREDRERKPSSLVDYQSALRAHLLPAFGDRELESITPEEIELWRRSLRGLSNRSKNKLLIQLHGIFRRARIVWNVPINPLARVEKHPMRPSGVTQVFSPEEVWALVRATASEQAGVLFLTAAFTGLRMGELLALRWRDVDFAGSTIRVRASYAGGARTTPKSGKVRAVPMAGCSCRHETGFLTVRRHAGASVRLAAAWSSCGSYVSACWFSFCPEAIRGGRRGCSATSARDPRSSVRRFWTEGRRRSVSG